jgi:L-alanine-DL-glutamate epimerase-like enolase superfamily enzyme
MLKLQQSVVRWSMIEPFIIANQVYDYLDTIEVSLTDGQGNRGRGETCGVDYHGETVASIAAQIESCRLQIEAGIARHALQQLLPAGGARNGLDCALLDMECAQGQSDVWSETGIEPASATATAYTIGIVGEQHATELALKFRHHHTLKIKVDESGSLATIKAVRAARAEARIILDANGSWDWSLFQEIEQSLIELDVALIEQPFAVGGDDCLLNYTGPLKIAADESVQTAQDLASLRGKYDVINIKLDKTGGLTEALKLAHAALDSGFSLMVGNMCGSSLAMAPGYVIAQLCEFVDLDGPLLQTGDVSPCLEYCDGLVRVPRTPLWAGINRLYK